MGRSDDFDPADVDLTLYGGFMPAPERGGGDGDGDGPVWHADGGPFRDPGSADATPGEAWMAGAAGGCAGASSLSGMAALERKSAEGALPLDSLARLLGQLTAEMQAQFELFRMLREAGGARLGAERDAGEGGSAEGAGETAAAKLARADIKAATDAMSLIVRTLEKIDTLQRQVARDRAEAAAALSAEDRAAGIRARFDALIEQQVSARLALALERLGIAGGAVIAGGTAVAGGAGGSGSGPPDGTTGVQERIEGHV